MTSLRYPEKEQNERNLVLMPIQSYYVGDDRCPNNASRSQSKGTLTQQASAMFEMSRATLVGRFPSRARARRKSPS